MTQFVEEDVICPEETIEEASGTLKTLRLMLLMKEREDIMKHLIEVDWNIWTLEESFRSGS